MDLSLPGGAGAERGHWAAWLEGAGLQREGRGGEGPLFLHIWGLLGPTWMGRLSGLLSRGLAGLGEGSPRTVPSCWQDF